MSAVNDCGPFVAGCCEPALHHSARHRDEFERSLGSFAIRDVVAEKK